MDDEGQKRKARLLMNNADELLWGLAHNWGKSKGTDALEHFPEDYRIQIEAEVQTCKALLKDLTIGASVDQGRLERFASDIADKVGDCKTVGMGRMVPIEVRTRHGDAPTDGWSVFYKWLPPKPADVKELPFPAPTPGASYALPPGLYAVRAEKTVDGKLIATEPETIDVAGKEKVVWWITVP